MRLNRELRTKNMTIRFHILWALFYVVLFSGFVYVGMKVYNEHNEDNLPSGHIVLSVGKEKYQLNDKITFQIENNFPNTIYVINNCPEEPLNVYKWVDNNWKQIHDTAKDKNSNCYKQPRRIAIGARSSIKYDFEDWPHLFKEPGVYRLVMKLDHYDDLPYRDFVILKPAKIIEVENNDDNTPAQTSPSAPTPANDDNQQSTTRQKESDEDKEQEPENEVDDD